MTEERNGNMLRLIESLGAIALDVRVEHRLDAAGPVLSIDVPIVRLAELRDALTDHLGDGDWIAASRVAAIQENARRQLCLHPGVMYRSSDQQMTCTSCGDVLTSDYVRERMKDRGAFETSTAELPVTSQADT